MMVNRKTVLALGAIATVGALALAGCASGGADEGGADETAGRAAGMNGYLTKPLSPSALTAALDALPSIERPVRTP